MASSPPGADLAGPNARPTTTAVASPPAEGGAAAAAGGLAGLPELDATCLDFLPPPDAWTARLSQVLVAALAATGLSLAFWPLRETVRAEGLVRPAGENSLIQSEIGGTVRSVLLRPNQTVAAGALLASLDADELLLQRQQLRSELAALRRQEQQARREEQLLALQGQALARLTEALTESSRRSAAQARASLGFERSQVGRYQSLLSSGAVARNLVEEMEARRQVSESEAYKALQGVAEQRARGLSELARLRQSAGQSRSAAEELGKQVAQRQARLQSVERALGQTRLVAPRAGSIVSTVLRHPGQVIRAGETVAVLAPRGAAVEVSLQVPARDISQLRPGQAASLRVNGCPIPEFGVLPGAVQSISADIVPGGSPEQPNRYRVLVRPSSRVLLGQNSRCSLREGMDVVADIVTRRTTVLRFLLNKLRPTG
jgi:HlyD family secretion protein